MSDDVIGAIIAAMVFGGLLFYGWAIWKPGRPLYEHGLRMDRREARVAVERAEEELRYARDFQRRVGL